MPCMCLLPAVCSLFLPPTCVCACAGYLHMKALLPNSCDDRLCKMNFVGGANPCTGQTWPNATAAESHSWAWPHPQRSPLRLSQPLRCCCHHRCPSHMYSAPKTQDPALPCPEIRQDIVTMQQQPVCLATYCNAASPGMHTVPGTGRYAGCLWHVSPGQCATSLLSAREIGMRPRRVSDMACLVQPPLSSSGFSGPCVDLVKARRSSCYMHCDLASWACLPCTYR